MAVNMVSFEKITRHPVDTVLVFHETVEKLSSDIAYLLESTNRVRRVSKTGGSAIQEAYHCLEDTSKRIQGAAAQLLSNQTFKCR